VILKTYSSWKWSYVADEDECTVKFCVKCNYCSGWPRPIGCLIFIGHGLQKSPINSGSFEERDLQLKASYASSPPCTFILMCKYDHFHQQSRRDRARRLQLAIHTANFAELQKRFCMFSKYEQFHQQSRRDRVRGMQPCIHSHQHKNFVLYTHTCTHAHKHTRTYCSVKNVTVYSFPLAQGLFIVHAHVHTRTQTHTHARIAVWKM